MLFRLSQIGCIEDLTSDIRWTPIEFELRVRERAAVLISKGIKPRSIVAIAEPASASFFADLFAVWTLGCAAACIDPSLTSSEIENVIDFVRPSAIVVGSTPLRAAVKAPALQLDGKNFVEPFPSAPLCEANAPALILFTSGTTGDPKGVVLSFEALLKRITLNSQAIGDACRRRTLVTLPTSFGHGLIGNALTPLLSGGDIVLHQPGLTLAQNLGKIIDQHRIGFLSSVPAFWQLVLKFSDAPKRKSLSRIHVGSAPLSARLWHEIVAWSGAEVVNCYGMTELANWVAGACSEQDGISDGLVGRPWGGQAAIKDGAGMLRAAGEGELLVRSPSVMSGYLNRPDLTASVVIDGWFHTGDTARIDHSGTITLTGRIKDEINRAGFKVQPAEIESLLHTHPSVLEACVLDMPDLASGEVVAAAVCPRPGQIIVPEDLQRWCAVKIRREAVPERWLVVDTMPRNRRGKIDRDTLRMIMAGDRQ